MTTRLEDERACERLVLDFVYYSDFHDYESLAALFAPEGSIMRPNGDILVGRDAILEAYQARAAGRLTRHLCTNIRITIESLERARGSSYAVLYSAVPDRPPLAHYGIEAESRVIVGEFEDEFVKTPEGWRFASRLARFVMHT